jgi:hypothetical protein
MEFNDRLPVFHNHWANNDSVKSVQEYLVLRFTYQEKTTDNLDVWQYKIVRYRILSPLLPRNGKDNKRDNLLCFDSWYPDYFEENIDSVRKNLVGEISLEDGILKKHTYEYGANQASKRPISVSQIKSKTVPNNWNANSDQFSAGSIFMVNYGTFFGSHSVSGLTDNLHACVERFISLIFTSKLLKDNQKVLSDFYILKQLEIASGDSLLFTIEPKENSIEDNHITAYLLPNGLRYAFKDRYHQKVLAITNASFDLPNRAVLLVTDLRTSKKAKNGKVDLVNFWPQSNSYVISSSKEQNDGVSKYTFSLKGGVEFIVNSGSVSISPIRLFISPGDSIHVFIEEMQEDRLKMREDPEFVRFCKTAKLSEDSIQVLLNNYQSRNIIKIKGTTDYLESSEKRELYEASIRYPTFSEEYKTFLLLKKKIETELNNIGRNPDILQFRKALVDFTYLKTYHYIDLLALRNEWAFLSQSNQFREKQHDSSGAPFRYSFRQEYYFALSNFSQLSLYIQVYNILNRSVDLDQESFYNEFMTNCGDTLLVKELGHRISGVKSIGVGQQLPFTELINSNEEHFIILPEKGKYGLLFLYDMPKEWDAFKQLLKKNYSDQIQYVSYDISRSYDHKTKNGNINNSLAEADSLELLGNYEMSEDLQYVLSSFSENVIVLYDDKGKIWYNSSYSSYPDETQDKYMNDIYKAIEQSRIRPKSKAKQLLLIILLSIFGTGGLAFFFYKIRIKQLKKKNAREKLIQELKLKSVQSQLNPHFLFNALNSIQVLVKSGDTKQADNYLVGFSELLRNVLQNADKRLVPLSEELKMVNRYCELEKVRLDFDCELKTDTQTNLDLIEVPYMLLQPIIENAIKHGVVKANGNGKLKIDISEKNAELNICISDNGPGLNGVPLDVLKEKGKGLKLSLEKLQSIYGADAELVFLTVNPGTTVSIKLKIG